MTTRESHDHIGNIIDFKASEDIRIHQFNLLVEKSWELVAQRRRKTHPRLYPSVQSDLNPTYFPLLSLLDLLTSSTLGNSLREKKRLIKIS